MAEVEGEGGVVTMKGKVNLDHSFNKNVVFRIDREIAFHYKDIKISMKLLHKHLRMFPKSCFIAALLLDRNSKSR